MPDWSYHVLFKPWLSKISPVTSREFIHKNMNRIASLPGGSHVINFLGREEISESLSSSIGNEYVRGPVGLSGKIDPRLTGTNAFSNLGFSMIEVGPVTMEPQKGDFPERKEGCILLPHQGESIGLEGTVRRLEKVERDVPFLFHLQGSQDEIVMMAKALQRFNGIFSIAHQDWEPKLVERLSVWKPVFLRVPSKNVSHNDRFPGAAGIILEESFYEGNLEEHKKALVMLRGYDVITIGGVEEPEDALSLFSAGASMVFLSAEYVDAGPGLPKRIHEALLDEKTETHEGETGWMWYFLFGLAVFLGGILALVFSLTSVILPYDEAFLGISRQELLLFNERILWFMAHDRMTLAGTMISGGLLYMWLSRFSVSKGEKWAKQAIDFAAVAGFLGILFFIGYGYFDWLHLLFWMILLPLYVTGWFKSRGLSRKPASKNRRNNRTWLLGVYGQFCFVALGFSFVLGGIIISYIGVTGVFIPTDITYLCMPPELIENFNDRLIPVIAHDRAGFGSALFSVGSLVLMSALWGYHQGKRWFWWMFLIGGVPAFAAGIFVHIMIGYTAFIHLLPAYIALLFYVGGLVLSYRYLMSK
ncbi:dihydroorotate dehydrogenase [Halobacillus sp. GSS1]|uniref:dihydroorotate dehydrogenase n=1 Tax=Halobacillus sp. GSS1 TaxID=2815919 RepID=UPI001A8BFDFB|nr:dihydroorotate dehydrogenase [Halobacillus sp. GSS1]MBN9654306.1 dihydroorotate dehydrogenase [Halobacillus sp. GSS1]